MVFRVYWLFYTIYKTIENGYDLLNGEYLEGITIRQLDEIFKGTTRIPLLKERFNIIKQLAGEFKKISNFKKLIRVNSDIKLLNNIISNFSNFKDISIYKEKEVYFFKRAILLVEDLSLNISDIKKSIKNINNMMGCADYKIPQVLRHLGILEYSKDLANLVDN